MRIYKTPRSVDFPTDFQLLQLQGTGAGPGTGGSGEPLGSTLCSGVFCNQAQVTVCDDGSDDYFAQLLLLNTDCSGGSLPFDLADCTVKVGSNTFTNCGSSIPFNHDCSDGQACAFQIQCLNTGANCSGSDQNTTVEITCPGFETCETSLAIGA